MHRIKNLQNHFLIGAYLGMKRALVNFQKGISCKPIRRLLEAKRASSQNECVKNNYIWYKEQLWRQRKVQIWHKRLCFQSYQEKLNGNGVKLYITFNKNTKDKCTFTANNY